MVPLDVSLVALVIPGGAAVVRAANERDGLEAGPSPTQFCACAYTEYCTAGSKFARLTAMGETVFVVELVMHVPHTGQFAREVHVLGTAVALYSVMLHPPSVAGEVMETAAVEPDTPSLTADVTVGAGGTSTAGIVNGADTGPVPTQLVALDVTIHS